MTAGGSRWRVYWVGGWYHLVGASISNFCVQLCWEVDRHWSITAIPRTQG
jgi:hypothetical protein